ncbi:hypothetical protein C8R43DRAFT_1200997 [Mycena crocata]|nr:hypothetical protein C8R43DRAFT_1200997 [Mycena crocata]
MGDEFNSWERFQESQKREHGDAGENASGTGRRTIEDATLPTEGRLRPRRQQFRVGAGEVPPDDTCRNSAAVPLGETMPMPREGAISRLTAVTSSLDTIYAAELSPYTATTKGSNATNFKADVPGSGLGPSPARARGFWARPRPGPSQGPSGLKAGLRFPRAPGPGLEPGLLWIWKKKLKARARALSPTRPGPGPTGGPGSGFSGAQALESPAQPEAFKPGPARTTLTMMHNCNPPPPPRLLRIDNERFGGRVICGDSREVERRRSVMHEERPAHPERNARRRGFQTFR